MRLVLRIPLLPLSNSLQHFLICWTLITPSPDASINWRWFRCGKHVSFINTKLHFALHSRTGFQYRCHCTLTLHVNRNWLTDSSIICCILLLLEVLSPTKKLKRLVNTKVTGLRTVLTEHALSYDLFKFSGEPSPSYSYPPLLHSLRYLPPILTRSYSSKHYTFILHMA